MIIVIADANEVAALIRIPQRRETEVLRPQTSGPCVHCEDGTPYRCTYSYGDGCPHLDNPAILCPVKDACYAMSEVARMREARKREQGIPVIDEQTGEVVRYTPRPTCAPPPEDDPVQRSDYVLAAPVIEPEPQSEIPPPGEPTQGSQKKGWTSWTPEEDTVLQTASDVAEARRLYREAFPESGRTDAAVSSRFHNKIRGKASPAGGEKPRGIYGNRRAMEADYLDGMQCDRPLSPETEEDYAKAERVWEIEIIPEAPTSEAPPAPEGGALSGVRQAPRDEAEPPHPWIGMRVGVLDPPDLCNRTGTVVQYNPTSQEMLIALDGSLDRVWLPPESLLLIGAGRQA